MSPLFTQPYQGYAYSYPHKSAYAPLPQPVSLAEAWAEDKHQPVSLYVHVPFCEMRCGFCNLFTTTNTRGNRVERYLTQLARQVRQVSAQLGPLDMAHRAIGGGTPTFLQPDQLYQLFDMLQSLGQVRDQAPLMVETSPRTTDSARLQVLVDAGVTRLSIGIQSFIDAEAHAMGRPASQQEVVQALDRIRHSRISALNIDLIYGAANQTPDSFVYSIHTALRWAPEEMYLYPLYVRPRTGLDGRTPMSAAQWDQHRLSLYQAGRDALLAAGYTQRSMRAFCRAGQSTVAPEYSCQEDGMLGLGAGARSYTRDLHYSEDFAVSRPAVQQVLEHWLALDEAALGQARYGVALGEAERMRRFVIKSILRQEGLDTARFAELFQTDPDTPFPLLSELRQQGYLYTDGQQLRPTALGLAWSDAIGPALVSPDMAERMRHFAVR